MKTDDKSKHQLGSTTVIDKRGISAILSSSFLVTPLSLKATNLLRQLYLLIQVEQMDGAFEYFRAVSAWRLWFVAPPLPTKNISNWIRTIFWQNSACFCLHNRHSPRQKGRFIPSANAQATCTSRSGVQNGIGAGRKCWCCYGRLFIGSELAMVARGGINYYAACVTLWRRRFSFKLCFYQRVCIMKRPPGANQDKLKRPRNQFGPFLCKLWGLLSENTT